MGKEAHSMVTTLNPPVARVHPPAVIPPRGGVVLAGTPGDTYEIAITSEMTGGACMVMHTTIAPGGGPPLHVHHEEDEWFYVIEGTMRFWVGGRVFDAAAGTFVFGPREIAHTWKNCTHGRVLMLVGMTPGKLEQFFRDFAALNADGSVPPDAELVRRILDLAPQYALDMLGENPL
jgi:quercetin dioxygenase-like cupin family protein